MSRSSRKRASSTICAPPLVGRGPATVGIVIGMLSIYLDMRTGRHANLMLLDHHYEIGTLHLRLRVELSPIDALTVVTERCRVDSAETDRRAPPAPLTVGRTKRRVPTPHRIHRVRKDHST